MISLAFGNNWAMFHWEIIVIGVCIDDLLDAGNSVYEITKSRKQMNKSFS
jgi:hypothetical protein